MTFKRVCRWSPPERLYRLARLTWERGIVGDGKGYSAKLSLGLHPVLFRVRRELYGVIVSVLGLRFHYQRAYGGRFG